MWFVGVNWPHNSLKLYIMGGSRGYESSSTIKFWAYPDVFNFIYLVRYSLEKKTSIVTRVYTCTLDSNTLNSRFACVPCCFLLPIKTVYTTIHDCHIVL